VTLVGTCNLSMIFLCCMTLPCGPGVFLYLSAGGLSFVVAPHLSVCTCARGSVSELHVLANVLLHPSVAACIARRGWREEFVAPGLVVKVMGSLAR
jgi:hypothetical protein